MICHWWLYGRKWPSPPLPKRKVGAPQYRTSPRNMKSSQHLVTRHGKKKKIVPTKKYLWVGGVYTMEKKDTNTDYQKFIGVGDQHSLFFFFAWDLYSLFFILGVFKSHLKKSPPPKVPIPTQNLFKSLLYKCSEKWVSPHLPMGGGGGGFELCFYRLIISKSQ